MERGTKPLSHLANWSVGPVDVFQAAKRPNRLKRQTTVEMNHEPYMRLALRLARKALGQTSPNPLVGALVVKEGRVVGAGYHRRAGAPHAETEALREAGSGARGATLYVTLEPCNHSGRTPPCCDAIIRSGLAHVVIAARDPNPITNGRGIERLRREGIDVVTGVLEEAARELNAPFHKAMTSGLPLVIAKVGQSLDGKIATTSGESRWITSEKARQHGHQLRRRVDAILVGINTVLQDDPVLTARAGRRRPARPLKVVVDTRLRMPPTARLLSDESPSPTLIATTARTNAKRAPLVREGVEVMTLPARQGRVPLRMLCRRLVRRGIQSVLIEGGGEVLASAFAERLVDRVIFFIAPILIGGRTAPGSLGGPGIARLSQAIRLEGLSVRRIGADLCVEARVVYPPTAS